MLIDLLEQKGITLKKKTGKEWAGPCPWCGGTDRFCVWPNKGTYWCRGCGKQGDDIQLLRDLEGMSYPEACEALGRPLLKNTPSSTKSEITDAYDYTDADGNRVFQVCRFDPKTFRQRRPGKNKPWIWDLKNTPLYLFQLPEVIKSDYVFICEGEKDCLSMKKIGLVATCNPMGAGKIIGQQEKHGILDPLQDKKVYIIPDNDKPGKDHADQVVALLAKSDIAAEIKVLELDVPPSGDVSDFIQVKGEAAVDAIRKLVKSTPAWKPESPFISVEELEAMSFESLVPIIGRGVLPAGERLLISGEAGVGKSMLRLELALHLVMGWDWLEFEVPAAKKVLMLQFENSVPIEQKRVGLMKVGLGISEFPAGRLFWIKRENRMDLTKAGDKDKLLGLVQQSGCDVVMYDCLSNLHSTNENDNVRMRNVLDVITDIDVACDTSSVMIHHFGKPGENPDDRYRTRGASSILDWCGTGIAFTTQKHEHKYLRKLNFIKVRDAPEIKPIIVERNGHFILEIVDLDSMCPPKKVREILDGLGGEVNKQGELIAAICDAAGCGDRSARSFLNKALEIGQISVRDHGKGRAKGYYVY